MKRFKDILCVVEAGKACKPVLERAVTLAENNQGSLTVVSVADRITAGIGMPDGGPISAALQATTVSTHTQELETLVDPYRPGFIMGNTAETILNQIDCSVLAIKPPGFKTPVTLAS